MTWGNRQRKPRPTYTLTRAETNAYTLYKMGFRCRDVAVVMGNGLLTAIDKMRYVTARDYRMVSTFRTLKEARGQ